MLRRFFIAFAVVFVFFCHFCNQGLQVFKGNVPMTKYFFYNLILSYQKSDVFEIPGSLSLRLREWDVNVVRVAAFPNNSRIFTPFGEISRRLLLSFWSWSECFESLSYISHTWNKSDEWNIEICIKISKDVKRSRQRTLLNCCFWNEKAEFNGAVAI